MRNLIFTLITLIGSGFFVSTFGQTGCTDSTALNYDSTAVVDDGSCQYDTTNTVYGCMDSTALNYNPNATASDGSCQYDTTCSVTANYTFICDTSWAVHFTATTNAVSPVYSWTSENTSAGNTQNTTLFIGPDSIFNVCIQITDNSNGCTATYCDTITHCALTPVYGCMDSTALNYNPNATASDGSCQYDTTNTVYGCMDPIAINFDPNATMSDSNCVYPVQNIVAGCTDSLADNYNPNATDYDGSCIYSDTIGVTIPGCMDPTATNYNSMANQDNGLCVYPNETNTNPIGDPNSIVDTVASYPIATCVIDYTIAIDSFSISGSTLISLDILAVDWIIWQNGNAVTISNNYIVGNDGNLLIYLVITCTTKSGQGTDILALGDVVNVNRSTLSNDQITTQPKLDEYIVIYPNPVVDETNINFSALADGNVQLNIYNAIGQMIDSKNIISINNKGNATINTSQFENGLYFITLKDRNGKVITSKFIK